MSFGERLQRSIKNATAKCRHITAFLAIMVLASKAAAHLRQLLDDGPYQWNGMDYTNYKRIVFERGYIDEYTNNKAGFCHSSYINDGLSLLSDNIMGGLYFGVLIYLFVGISIISDIFMESIEVITSQTVVVIDKDEDGFENIREEVVWNPTLANLTLMALGSSAPEILLSIVETSRSLESEPGKLGASTIVGSAAFNLLMITAVSIVSVKDGLKKINDLGVFAITSVFSVFAYIWIYYVLRISTPDEVTLFEALLTFAFFFILLIFSYSADRYKARKDKKIETEEQKEQREQEKIKMAAKAKLRQIAKTKEPRFVIECVTGGPSLQIASSEEINDIKANFKLALGVQNLNGISVNELMAVLDNPNLIERIAFRKQTGASAGNNFLKMKGVRVQTEQEVDNRAGDLNPEIGFKSLSYSVTESSKFVEITILKKVHAAISFVIKTMDDTAKAPDDYEAVNEMVTMAADVFQMQKRISVVDSDIWEPDRDFLI